MKPKPQTVWLVSAVAVLVGLIVVALASSFRNPVLGKWEARDPASTNKCSFEFFKEGTMVATKGDVTIGRYSVIDNSHLKMDFPNEGAIVAGFVIHEEAMILSMPGNDPLTFTKVK